MGGNDREKKTYVPLKIRRWYSSAVGAKNNEPEYEEVGPPTAFRKKIEKRNDGQHCDLCGSSEAAVRCDKCGSQAFCLSCDDMYHRHPRRSTHVRKAVDSINSGGGGVRPPLPPKGESQGAPPPQPPPRKNKRSGFLGNSGLNKKEQNYQYSTGAGYSSYRSASLTNLQNGQNNEDGGARYSLALPIRKNTSAASEAGGSAGRTIMGSLKRFMGARPLPPTPDQPKGPIKNERPASATPKILTKANTSPSLPNLNAPLTNDDIRTGLPQSVLDINRAPLPKNSTSTPVTPASAHAQYPPLQPKSLQSNAHTQSLGRKFSLQQLPQSFEDKRTSLVEGTPGSVPWDGEAPKPAARTRSQSVSDDQWAQMMAAQPVAANTDGFTGPTCPPGHTPADMSAFAGATTRRSYNTMGARSGSSFGRGMVSSASVCDLNSLAQQQSQHGFSNSHPANSFQQLNMSYNNGMMWGAPCDLCQSASMFAGHPNASGMKRTASNLSMNLSSVGSDVSGYQWGPPPPHMHHHLPPMYLGYYPGYHPHMVPPPMGSGMGLNMSIPDSMHTFGKVPSSPAPSVRSSSHRSHKSSKSRSFSAADASGRSSRARKLKRSEESEESRSSSVSDDDEIDDRENKSGHQGSSIAWQCDHCTFINSGGVRTCGMCSKTIGSSGRSSSRRGSERRRSERRRDRRTDHEDDDRELSDYDNDGGVVKSNLSFNIKDSKRDSRSKAPGSGKSKSKKKSRRRGSSATESGSGSEGGDDERLERHMRDLRLSSSSSRRRGSDYDGINNKDKDRERERSSRKKEGSSGRFKNRGKSHSERSRTPGRQTPRRSSPVDDDRSREGSPEPSPPDDVHNHDIVNGDSNGHQSSIEGTVVNTIASEATAKIERKSGSGSSDRENKAKEGIVSSPVNAVNGLNITNEKPNEPSIPEKAYVNKSRSCSPRLRIEKSKSPARSQRTSRGDADEPSFANTLDDITTIGTNEVADQDLSQYIDEQAHSTAEQPQLEQQDEIPVLNYIRPTTPVEEVAEEQGTVANEPLPVISENLKVGIQEIKKVVTKDTGQPQRKQEIPDSVYEPSYEPIEEPVQVEAPTTPETNQTVAQIQIQDQNIREETDDGGTIDKIKAVDIKQGSPMVSRNMVEVIRSASSNSSLGPSSPQDRDRQYTPLSRSSSDAQFYSPPDSPDLSLSEQLRDIPANSQTQAYTLNQDSRPTNNSQTLRNREDEYLFTALETMQTAQTDDNLKSSRETIRSSMEQLPYSEEAFEGEKEKDIPPRPASAGAVSAPPTDGYESLSFQDALTSSGASKLPRSSSAKDLLLSTSILDNTAQKMSSGIVSLQQEADRQARAAAWSTEELSEKYLTVEEIITKRRQKVMETQGLQLVQVLRDAEDAGYTAEEVSIALTHCGDKNPLEWLKENWKHMVDTVLTLATNYGHERRVNDIGAISAPEARLALRVHKGNIWAAVTESVEQRQKKFNEIDSRGKFKREDVVKALEKHNGDVDAAYLEVNQTQLKPFMMKIWNSIASPSPSHNKVTQSTAPTITAQATVETRESAIPKVAPMPQETTVSTQTILTAKDVVVHPLKAFTHYADLSVSEYSEGRIISDPLQEETHVQSPMLSSDNGTTPASSHLRTTEKDVRPTHEALQEKNVALAAQHNKPTQKKPRKYSSTLHVSLSSKHKVSEHTIERFLNTSGLQKSSLDQHNNDGYESISTPLEEKERLAVAASGIKVSPSQPESKSAPTSARNSLLLEDFEVSDEEEESISITTGRLSLSLSAASINVKSEVIQTEQVPAGDHEQDTDKGNLSDPQNQKKKDSQSVAETDAVAAEGKTEDVNASDDDKNTNEIHSVDEPGMAQTRTGPVTVQKASVIVGKAIAKAMARETSVRESQSRSVTPEVQETTLTTPEPSEVEEEPPVQATVSDSDDEDHLRTLDTIPEEEEISDRTESRVSRSASRNHFLPFNPTDIIQLSPVAKALNKLIGIKTETKKPASATAKKTPAVEDSIPGTPHSYYNAAQQHTYYNQSGEKNYYNESGAKIEGESEPSKNVALDDYESMAEVKEELSIILRNDDVKTDNTNGETASPDLDNDDDDDETIYYEEIILKPGEEEASEGGKNQSSGTRRRRRRRSSRELGSDYSGAASRADVVESPSVESAPASVPPTPSPPPAIETLANTSSNQETSTIAEGTTEKSAAVKTGGKKSELVDQRTYDIIQMSKSPPPTKAFAPESSGESEEEDHGSSKTVSLYDRLKVPNLLVQIEGLKARHGKDTDYQEVRELKEQIQMMRKQLEARMEEDGEGRPDTPETPQDEELPPMGPVIHLQKSPSTERPPSREYEQLKFDRTVRRLLAEGQAGSYEKAELAAQLLSFNFKEGDAIQAAEDCSSIYTAIQFLQQECELCAEKYPMGKMVSMLQCIHRCCKECAKTYFTFQIKTKNIRDLRCPFCNEPDLDDCEEIANEYLNNMDILLKSIIDPETHELFQRKLRDWTLMKDPNFRWCNKCSSGFIANPRARKLICPDCKDVTCAQCRTTWENAHDGISCEAFAQWKTDNDLEVQAQGVAKHLAENGITCPKCKFTYSLAKGGCMHFTCTQCKYEFCSGCGQPFRQGSKCPVGPYCERLGLHAHHPRNCLFYLRDKEPHQLQNLLKEAGISFDTESRHVRETGQRVMCLVQEQKELPDGLKDDVCGRIVPEGYAGLCKLHYTEYLVEKINTHKLDPVNIFDEADLRVCLRRNGKPVPVRRWESEKLYRDKLIKLIKEHLPLDSVEQ